MDFLSADQKKILGWSIAGISLSVLVGILFLLGYGFFALIRELQDVVLPFGIATIISYILHPVVVWIQDRTRFSRTNSILLIMGILGIVFLVLSLWILPKVFHEAVRFSSDLPQKIEIWDKKIDQSLRDHREFHDALNALQNLVQEKWPEWSQKTISLLMNGAQGVGGKLGLFLGFIFVPLYLFYLLRDQASIESTWKKYIPLHPSPWKEELIFVLTEINRYLIVFFRGQVLIALMLGLLTSLGLMIIGLPYAILIGMMTGFLSIVPYLGVVIGLAVSGFVAFVQPDGGWGFVMAVGIVFTVVQVLEGCFISPRIMGERTGLHPLTVILAIMVWSHLLGGFVGAILAIPLTATLRVLMFRYIWRE